MPSQFSGSAEWQLWVYIMESDVGHLGHGAAMAQIFHPSTNTIARVSIFGKVKLRVHLGLYEDETADLCHWHIPETHYLETWSDARAFDGTVTIMQPLIAPLYGGKSAHELLAALMGQPDRSSYAIVRDYWRGQLPPEDFEWFWRTALHEGLIANTALPPREVAYGGLRIEDGNLPSPP